VVYKIMEMQNPDSRLLTVKQLNLIAGGNTLVEQLDLSLPSGIFCGIVGPNGSGKTTLIRTLAGLRKPDKGSIHWKSPVRLSYLSQSGVSDPAFPISVQEVFESAWIGIPRNERSDRAFSEMIELMGLAGKEQVNFGILSGGLQQRCLLGRTLLRPADVYLLDEPFSALDSQTVQKLAPWLASLTASGKTIFMIHHDLSGMKPYFTHLLELDGVGGCFFKGNRTSISNGLSSSASNPANMPV